MLYRNTKKKVTYVARKVFAKEEDIVNAVARGATIPALKNATARKY